MYFRRIGLQGQATSCLAGLKRRADGVHTGDELAVVAEDIVAPRGPCAS